MTNPLYDEYARRFPPATQYAEEDTCFAARLQRLKRRVQGSEPFEFDSVMEHVYTPAANEVFIDNCIVEYDGKVWNFHIVGDPEMFWKTDPRIGKLNYEFVGYATGSSLFDFEYHGRVMDTPTGEWDCIAPSLCMNIVRFKDGSATVYNAVGLRGTRLGVAFSKDLINWERSPRNPVLGPLLSWAEPFGACKDCHVQPYEGGYLIYYVVTAKSGYSAVALASTRDFENFEYQDTPVFLFPAALRGTSAIESVSVFPRDGIFHLFFCCGPGTWHTISDNPHRFRGTNGVYLMGPFVAGELFQWNSEWWFSSTKKEELRRLDRLKGISNHATVADERRNLAGMFLSHVRWEGDFPVLEKPAEG
jgi:hypothetical protein